MAAESLVRSQSYLGARYRYLRAKLGGLKAVKAMARVLACVYYRLVTKGQVWVDRGTVAFEQRRQQRDLASLQRTGFGIISRVADDTVGDTGSGVSTLPSSE